jgi:hypothetical protein
VIPNDFESALDSFGASALLFRTIQLCRDCPKPLRRLLIDFRQNWQWLELERIRKSGPDITMRTAYTMYVLCSLLDPPEEMPFDSGKAGSALDALAQSPLCSPWTAVIPLDGVGAFGTDD